jgi:hypothetical protein
MAGAGFDTQAGHLFFATTLVLLAARLGYSLWRLAAFWVVAAAVKEFWFDMQFEVPAQTWAGSAEDFGMYCAGIALGLLLLTLRPVSRAAK